MSHAKHRGFSLVEMLMVILIIGIIAAFAVPAVVGVNRGSQLTKATQTISDELALARQTAIARNRQVELRLYQYADPQEVSSASSFRALQIFEVINARTLSPLDKVVDLPTTMIVDSSPVLSSLMDPSKRTIVTGSDALPRVGTIYKYVALRFRPDGSTDLLPTQGPWFLTVHDETKGDGLNKPPPNFSTLEIDPLNGNLRLFRPGF